VPSIAARSALALTDPDRTWHERWPLPTKATAKRTAEPAAALPAARFVSPGTCNLGVGA
jgi:hypothetical protein